MNTQTTSRLDKRGQRAWVHVQLPDSDPAHQTAQLVKDWKSRRQAATNITKAIQLYATLCQGDTSVLVECFPGLAIGWPEMSPPVMTRRGSALLSITAVTVTPRSEDEETDDALNGLGLEALDFGE